MKRTISLSLLMIGVLLFFGSTVYGGWKNKVVSNQVKAAEYIMKLQKGANPDTLQRPSIRRDDKAKAKSANREVKEAMDQAERLARAGQYKRIANPTFKAIVSDEAYEDAEKKYRKK